MKKKQICFKLYPYIYSNLGRFRQDTTANAYVFVLHNGLYFLHTGGSSGPQARAPCRLWAKGGRLLRLGSLK